MKKTKPQIKKINTVKVVNNEGIYKITNPNGKVYIGQSIDIDKRWNKYKVKNCKPQIRLYNSLNKYGGELTEPSI